MKYYSCLPNKLRFFFSIDDLVCYQEENEHSKVNFFNFIDLDFANVTLLYVRRRNCQRSMFTNKIFIKHGSIEQFALRR